MLALIYGGETTVSFGETVDTSLAKGGRNQEMVLAFLHELVKNGRNYGENAEFGQRFLFFSLGSDGEDGPTDATGAFIHSENINSANIDINLVEKMLKEKRSYEFWSNFNEGTNLVKIGKTGSNLMDIQILILA